MELNLSVHCDFTFRAAHYLRNGYPGKCKNLHGEFYRIEVWVSAKEVNKYGFVVDFGDVKNLIYGTYDHKCMNELRPFDVINPTAENMAIVFLGIIQDFCSEQENKPIVTKLRVYESTNDYAEVSLA